MSSIFVCKKRSYKHPMVFCMDKLNTPPKEIAENIVKHGGKVVENFFDDPYTIILSNDTDRNLGNLLDHYSDIDRFEARYITLSIGCKRAINVNVYRIPAATQIKYTAMDVLQRKTSWMEILGKEVYDRNVNKQKQQIVDAKNADIRTLMRQESNVASSSSDNSKNVKAKIQDSQCGTKGTDGEKVNPKTSVQPKLSDTHANVSKVSKKPCRGHSSGESMDTN